VSLQDSGGSGAYLFGPADLTFSVGDTITLELTSEGKFHTFTVDDLGIDVGVDPGSTETLEFTFAEAGTYTLICVPHEVLGMVGTITVQLNALLFSTAGPPRPPPYCPSPLRPYAIIVA
jgi:plastocyanin